MLTLATRTGSKPRTTGTNPHQQLDQNSPPEVYRAFKERAFDFPDVERRPSMISVPGAEALWLDPVPDPRPEGAFMIGNEFAHVHPAHDGSMHMMLPREDVREVLKKGWGELHPMALKGLIPPNAVMIFGPRDAAELDVALQIIGASHRFARGE